jgi:exonuclease VII large subunit
MKIRVNLPLLLSCLAFLSVTSLAQTTTPPAADQLTGEVAALRKSLQTLNNRLQAISDELLSPNKQNEDKSVDTVKKVTTNLDLLTHAEERAEVLRKQLIDLIEKETAYKSRMTQFDEDLRPENIDRSMAGMGGTRTAELRDARRRALENEKKGVENLLSVTVQSRIRLEEDVRQADLLVTKLRQRLFPLIDREIDKLPRNDAAATTIPKHRSSDQR